MENTKIAVKYGMDTLGVSPDEMFSLFEVSKGYDGQDYSRWLAGKIIDIAEKDGVGFSQLLVKKFDIIEDLKEEYADSMVVCDSIKKYIEKVVSGGTIYSVGMEGFGISLDDLDWYNGIDYGLGVYEFYNKFSARVNDGDITLCVKLSSKGSSKKSDLFKEAKFGGLVCQSEGSLMLYRLVMLCNVMEEVGRKLSVVLVSDGKYIASRVNSSIIKYFTDTFKVSGNAFKSAEFYGNSLINGKTCLCFCSPRNKANEDKYGIILKDASLDGNTVLYGNNRRYSYSDVGYFEYLSDSYDESDVLGYLNYGSQVEISTEEDSLGFVKITKSNLSDVVVCFSIAKALEGFGMSVNVGLVPNGHDKYEELYYNCLPVFLFDACNSVPFEQMKSWVLSNGFSDKNKELYFSFEAKELYGVYKSLNVSDCKGKPFKDILFGSCQDSFLEDDYKSKLVNLKDYINSMYRGM